MAEKDFVRTSTLRDFRVDQSQNPSNLDKPEQNIRNRQSLVTEWTQGPQSIDALWEAWTEEQSKAAPIKETPKQYASPKPRTQSQPQQQQRSGHYAVDLSQKAPVETQRPASTRVQSRPAHRQAPLPLEEGAIETISVQNLPWAAELAQEERRLEKAGAVDLSNTFGRQEILKARTREFAQNLQKLFREQIDLFNECRKSAAHAIHVYKVAGAPDDFMLYRNGLKLLISAQRAGKIQFAFNQYIGQLHAPSHQSVIEIDAAWGAFDQLIWTFRSERVQMQDIVRYFLTEFSRQSFR